MFDPLSLGILALSALAKSQANEDAADRRETLRRTMEAYQRSRAAEAQAATQALIDKQTPKARTDELQQVTQDRTQSLRDTVGAAQAFNAPPVAGKLSNDYKTTDEANAMRVGERTRRAIEQIAAMGAPGEQELQQGIRFGRAATSVNAANTASKNVGDAYLMDIDQVRPGRTLGMLADLGMGLGSSMAMNSSASALGNAAIDAGANNGQGYADAADNLYNEGVTTRDDARIQRETRLKRALSLWGTVP